MQSSDFAPYTAFAIGVGFLVAVFYAYWVARAHKHTTRRATFFLFGDSVLSRRDSSRSLFATWMSVGNVVVGALIIAFSYRILATWAVLTWVAGFFILSRHSPAILTEASRHMTLHEFLRQRFASRMLSRLTSLFAIVTSAGVISLELVVGAALIRAVGLPVAPLAELSIVVLFLATLVVGYTRLGGLSAVIATDRVQAMAIGAALLALLVIATLGPEAVGGLSVSGITEAAALEEPNWVQLVNLGAFFLGFGAFQLFLLLGDMTTWQRLQLGETTASVRRAARSTGLNNLVAWSLLLFTGLALLSWPAGVLRLPAVGGDLTATLSTQAEPLTSMLESASTGAIRAPLLVGCALVIIVTFGLFCAILSTCDSFLLMGVQAFLFGWTREGATVTDRHALEEPSTDARIVRKVRGLLPVLMLTALIIFGLVVAAGMPLVSVIFFVFASQCAVAPLAVAALYAPDACPSAAKPAISSLIVVAIAIGVLFALSGTTSSLSLAYAYSYAAPVAAIGIPLVFLAFHRTSGGRSLLFLGRWMIDPPSAPIRNK